MAACGSATLSVVERAKAWAVGLAVWGTVWLAVGEALYRAAGWDRTLSGLVGIAVASAVAGAVERAGQRSRLRVSSREPSVTLALSRPGVWERVKAWNRWAAPPEVRWPVRLGTLVVMWATLGLAGVGYVATFAAGVAAATAGEVLIDWWWARRERRLDERAPPS